MSDRPPGGKAEGGKKSGVWGFLKNALGNVSVEINVGPVSNRAPAKNPIDPAACMEPVRHDRKETYDEMVYRTTDGREGQAPMVRVDRERQHVARSLAGRGNAARERRPSIPASGGEPLSEDVRARMEPKLGADLSNVTIHRSGESAAAAQGLNAKAFAVGQDIHFGNGQFLPGSKEGDRLLAHELAHTVQAQRSGVQRKPAESDVDDGEVGVSQPDEQPEREADEVADRATDSLHGNAGGPAVAAGEHGSAGRKAAAGHGAASSSGGAAASERPAIQRKPISAAWIGVGNKIHRRPAPGSAPAAARPAASPSAAAAGGAAPAGPVEFTEKAGFSMSGEDHTLTAHYKDGVLDMTMASMPKEIVAAINAQKVTEQGLIATLHGSAKAEREAALAALNDLQSWYDAEKAKIVAVTDPIKRAAIDPAIKALTATLKTKIVSIGNTYKIHDFVSKSFGIDGYLTTLDNQVNKELRKHLGEPNLLGDGHNNTAAAAELLGMRTKNGVAVPYLAGGTQHATRTRTCLDKMRVVVQTLDKIEADFGVHVSSEPLYKEAQKEIAGCTQTLADPAGYLAARGFKVVAGDFKPL